tara:strand:- start:1418 stop:2455 length:1038 start_codon:yes stop_codon:yes gene_type:complete
MDTNIVYNINSILSKDYNKIKNNTKIYLCIYNIVNRQYNPFLVYLLYKYPKLDILSFPNFKLNNNPIKEINNFYHSITGISTDPSGYLIYNSDVYVFFNIDIKYKVLNKYNSKNELWWTTIYEMCNSKKLLYFNVNEIVSELFLNYTKLIYLVNENKMPYTIPRIGYYGCYHSLISYVTLLGFQQSSYSPYGNYFYFNNFKRAVKYGGWSFKGVSENKDYIIKDKYNKYDKGGIVRFALFLDNTKMFLNHPDDKKTKYSKTSDLVYYKDIPRLVDLTGQWAYTNDSAYIGILNVKRNGRQNTFHNTIREQYVLKDIYNYFALSSHIIDAKTLGNEWNYSDDYKII